MKVCGVGVSRLQGSTGGTPVLLTERGGVVEADGRDKPTGA